MSPRPLRLRVAWLAIGWLLVLVVGYLSLAPSIPSVDVRHFDKAGHFLAYLALMTWFGFLYERRRHLLIAAAVLALGVALEFAQMHFGHRQFEWLDIIANCTGVTVGWLISGTRLAELLVFVEARLGQV